MGRLRIISISLGLLAALALVSSANAVESEDYYESLRGDDEVRQSDTKESVTEYPNGVNVIPGEAEIHYPIYSKIPKSSFSCLGRPAGFYADTELRCQVWHICDEASVQQSFLCTNGTIYSQDKRVCDWWYNVNCDPEQVNRDYEQNRDLFKGPPPKAQDDSYSANEAEKSNVNDIPSARKTNSQPQPQKLTYEQSQQQPQQRRPTNAASGDNRHDDSENQYTEPEEYQQRQQSQRPPHFNTNHYQAPQNHQQNQQNHQQPQQKHQNHQQTHQQNQQPRTQASTNKPANSPPQGAPVPEKKRVIVLRLPGPLPPGATIPPHILREYAESVLAAERAGKPPPTGLAPRPAQSSRQVQQPAPTQAPQRPPQQPQNQQNQQNQQPQQQRPAQSPPPIKSAPFKPVVPYTPRPFSQFLEQASKYNGQTRPQAQNPQQSQNQNQNQNSRPVEQRPIQTTQPTPSRQELEERIRLYEESRKSTQNPQNQPQQRPEEPRRQSSSASRAEHEEVIRRYEESRRATPPPTPPQRQPQEEPRVQRPAQKPVQNAGNHQRPENQYRQPQNQPQNHHQNQNRQNQQSPPPQNRQPEAQYQQKQPQPENRHRQPESQPQYEEQFEDQYTKPKAQSQPQSQTPFPEKKAVVKPHKAPAHAHPAEPTKKFRHSTPRKHVNVKFAPKGSSSLEESEDERQFPEESRRPAYPFQFNNFHAVPHHIAEPVKEDIHVKTSPIVQEKPRRRPQPQHQPQEFLKESFVEPILIEPTTPRVRTTSTTTTTQKPQVAEDAVVHRLVVVARQGLKVKDPSQEEKATTTTTERAQDFRRARYESVKVQKVQTPQVQTTTTTNAPITTPAPRQTFQTSQVFQTLQTQTTPYPEDFTKPARRVIKVKKLRPTTTTENTRITEDLGFDVYGRNPDEDEEEELIRAAQLYQEASEHYGKRRRPTK